jgi:hypothetical protein
MAEIRFQEWQALYLQALQEPLDSVQLPRRLDVAETSIFNRLQELVSSSDPYEEPRALAMALRSLSYVRNGAAANAAKREPEQLRTE